MKQKIPLFEKLTLLINGTSGLFTLAFLIFGIVISYNNLKYIDIEEFIYLTKDTSIGKGEILNVFEATYSDEDEEVTSYGFDYVFFSPIGDLNWTSYANQDWHHIGDTLDIEYSTIRPSVNRIKGMHNNTGGYWDFLILIFPVTAFFWTSYYVFRGFKKIEIIVNGNISEGFLFHKEKTNTEINDSEVYKMVFRFIAHDKKVYEAITKTHKSEKLEDEKSEKIIYHKDNPNKALIVDSLPWSVPEFIKREWK